MATAGAAWEAVLGRAVRAGGTRVDYAVVEAARPTLRAFLDAVAAAPMPSAPKEQIALLANAYNALVIDSVLRADLVKTRRTVLDVKGFFDGQTFVVAGVTRTLNALEAVIRPLDARVHVAVNCASEDCPALRPRLWRAGTLDTDLDDAAGAFLARPGQLVVTPASITTNQIFEWYRADFAQPGQAADDGVRSFLRRHGGDAGAQVQTQPLRFRPYRWGLNAA